MLVFGLGRLHHLWSPRERFRLIAAAIDAGVRAFDVAPAYGNGLAEHELGRALRCLRVKDVEIRTKVGIPVCIYPKWPARYAFPLARGLDMASGSHRRAYRSRDFHVETIRRSVDESKRRLGVDRVHRLYLHEPTAPFSNAQLDAIATCLLDLVGREDIGEWGIAGPRALYAATETRISFAVQQPFTEWLGSDPAARHPRPTLYGIRTHWSKLRSSPDFWQFLRDTHRTHPSVDLLVSTNRADRVRDLVKAMDHD